MKYSEKLKDPRWQKKRLEIFQRDGWKCVKCRDGTITLHVHHKTYIPDSDPWDHPDDLLETLCETCHLAESSAIIQIEAYLKYIGVQYTISKVGISDKSPEEYLISITGFRLNPGGTETDSQLVQFLRNRQIESDL